MRPATGYDGAILPTFALPDPQPCVVYRSGIDAGQILVGPDRVVLVLPERAPSPAEVTERIAVLERAVAHGGRS